MNEIETKFYECFKRTIETGFIKKIEFHTMNIIFEYTRYDSELYFEVDKETIVSAIDIKIKNINGEKTLEYVNIFDPQVETNSGYISDFHMINDAMEWNGMCIEIDGHDLHEKSKDQAQRDKKRDRNIISNGEVIIHFTGSEVYTNCQACVDETLEIYVRSMLCKMYQYGDHNEYFPNYKDLRDENGRRIYGGR